jgi:phospholipid/cholesterol/gamma-HCH transport system ATP-binding protein
MNSPVIELNNVTIELGGETILKDINLTVLSGETLVLIGPSGGGKTVLIKTMAGIYEPTHGQVLCYGHEWKSLSIAGKHDLAKKVGVQFQKSALFDEITAFENVAFPLIEHGETDKDKIKNLVDNCLKSLNLEKAARLLPHEMSGGMRQRLGIARAIILKPEILFMDDPTAGLDPLNSDQTAELIMQLKKDIGCTLIIVTHDMMRAYQLAGRIVLVADGTVIETGSEAETKKNPDPRVQQFINGRTEGPLRPV